QVEYFNLYAIFNQTEDADRPDDSPFLTLASPRQAQRKASLEAKVKDLEKQLLRPDPALDSAQEKWEKEVQRDNLPGNVRALLAIEPAKRNPAQKEQLERYFRSTAPALASLNKELAGLKGKLAAIKPVTTLIMKELPPGKRRKTHVLL